MTTGVPMTPTQRALPRWRRFLFALVPLVALLLLAEVVVRAVRAPLWFDSFRLLRTDLMARNYPAERDALLGYVPRPNFESRDNHWGTLVSIDADGMRRNGGTPPGGEIVAAVGDSFTFGDQVDDDATWPAQLEGALAQPVKNGGVFGYSLVQSVLRGEAMIERFPISTLIVSFIPDDLVRSEFRHRYTPVPWFDLDGDGLVLRNVPLDHAAGTNPAKAWKDALGYSALLDAVLAGVAPEWWFGQEKQVSVPHLVGKGAEIGKRLVERLAARCRARNVGLLLVLQGPTPDELALGVLRHAEAHGVETLDLATRFAEQNRLDPTLQHRYFAGHMTREGNHWVAEAVASVLRVRK
ncbi:MAG: hypothetical protein ABIP94_14020 [Planctomycetota bacterium]